MENIDFKEWLEVRQVYLIGIGGAGMSGLARLLRHRGFGVSGSDVQETPLIRQLREDGIRVFIGQQSPQFSPADDLIIYSSAITESHVELKAARLNRKKILHRAEVLSSLMNAAKTFVAVAGTHGKTTTTSMISFVLKEMGKDPTCLVGGELMNFGTNAIFGNSGLYVAEVDESDQSHELFLPHYAVLTNLEEDHVDHYKTADQLRDSFEKFIQNLRDPGLVIYSEDDRELRNLVLASEKPKVSFGFSLTADFSAQNIVRTSHGTSFDLCECGFYVTRMELGLLGLHNVANALAATALLIHLGLHPDEIKAILARFRGAKRRLEVKWKSKGMVVINDYAHHPTEVMASISALKDLGKHLTVIFQPHRFSRTQYFYKQFGRVFGQADDLILTDIYGAGEQNVTNIHVSSIYDEVKSAGHPSARMLSKDQILPYLMNYPNLSGVIAFIGAGDIGEIANEFANRFKNAVAA